MSANEKTFLGRRMMDFSSSPALQAYSRVTLYVDDDNCYTAGDDTGRTLEAECPWATQEICNNVLAMVKGYQYIPFTATDALIDPASEIGDGVTANGKSSIIASIEADFDAMFTATVEAPMDEELDHEYPYKSSASRAFDRKIARTRAAITVKADEIMSKVEDELNALSSSIDVKLDGITSTVQGIDGRVTTMEQTASGLTTSVQELNGQVSTIQQTASGLTTTVQGITGEINTIKQTIQGVVYESSLADGTTVINGGCLMTNSVSADRLILTGSITFDDLTAELQALVSDTGPDLPNYIRSTYIASTEIRSPTITGNEIRALGSFQVGTGSADNFTGTGYMGYAEGLGAGDTVTKGVAISNSATLASGAGNNYVIVTDGGIRDQVGTNHAYLTPDVYSLLVGDHELRLTNAGVLTLDGNSIGSAGEDVTVTPVWG